MKQTLMLLSLALVLAGCGPADQSAKAVADTMTLEQKFIVVATGRIPESGDKEAARAKELIERAAGEYGIKPDLVADQAYMAQKIAKKDGVSATAMEVLEAATLAYVKDSGSDFASMASMYLGLRSRGIPHAEAMLGMKGLVGKVASAGDAARRK